ncbi:DUF1229 domain-containing protein [Leptospira ognonensis]|uniref:DUF1229 domain-containing protein n=1 Tax=Leptospira ognonensis TaxID=2484945 RepID=A0A4R9JWZ7_9LEPT|nr:DUF1229 domain-containing protein [Leptospira ognonensis]TGL56530.1 DUF1229 domain-containing protein [Leptospira ognonensis]
MKKIFFGLPNEYFFLGLLTGIGFLNYSLPVFVLGMFVFAIWKGFPFIQWDLHKVLVFSSILLFYVFYYLFYQIPVTPIEWKFTGIDFYGHSLRFLPALFTFVFLLTLKSRNYREGFLVSVSLGMMVFAVLMTIATVIHFDPPYYGKSFHFYDRTEGNSPGITVLANILPIAFLCFHPEVYLTPLKNIFLSLFALALLFLGLYINYLFSARTFVFLIGINLTLILAFQFFSFYRKGIQINFKIFLVASASALLLILFTLYALKDSFLIHRILNQNFDVKIHHFLDYFANIKNGFFIYPKVDTEKSATYWFHNVFFDAHRTSGPWTALTLYFYFAYTFVLAAYRTFKGDETQQRYLHLYINIFLLFITCIPFESSESQLMVIFIGIGGLIVTTSNSTNKLESGS